MTKSERQKAFRRVEKHWTEYKQSTPIEKRLQTMLTILNDYKDRQEYYTSEDYEQLALCKYIIEDLNRQWNIVDNHALAYQYEQTRKKI